jgi:PIN domain nuclease of toxin-antitoxin system
MRLLLDTHVFLWLITNDARLPAKFRDALSDANNGVFLSVASVWESVIKFQAGKLPLPESPETYLPRQREKHDIATLAIDEASISQLAQLPLLHRDPFDRIIIAQALQQGMTLVTVDEHVLAYPVATLPS